MSGQALTDARDPGFSYITHSTMHALHRYFRETEAAKLSTGIALYVGIAYLLSIEEHDGRHQGTIEKTREEIGEAGGLSATNVTRYAEHLVNALVLQLELQLARGANTYLWRLVEPPIVAEIAPHQNGEAPRPPLHGGDAPHQIGEGSHHPGEAYIDKETDKKTDKKPPVSPPGGDDQILQQVFDFWVKVMAKSSATEFSPKRQRVIRARLKDGRTEIELKRAIRGCANSDWHMKRGKHVTRDGPLHNDLTLIFRDAEHLEEFTALAPAMQGPSAPGAPGPLLNEDKARRLWDEAKARLRSSMKGSSFMLWINPLEAAGERADRTLVLVDGSDHGGVGQWASRRYKAICMEALGEGYSNVEFVDETQLELEAAA